MGDRFITPEGFARIRAEYQQLFGEERPRLVEVISWAAGNGDRSENGDYIYGRRRLREIDRRLGYLAYQRARQLAPRHPAPLFFEGLARARAGERDQALALWTRALALTPSDASYRQIITGGIQALSTRADAGVQPSKVQR